MYYMVHEIPQARILEWVAFPFSKGSSWPRDQTQVSHIVEDSLPSEPPRKPLRVLKSIQNKKLNLDQQILKALKSKASPFTDIIQMRLFYSGCANKKVLDLLRIKKQDNLINLLLFHMPIILSTKNTVP